ncbi:MAG: class I SAM-dependent methyltransferase [Patescibacteria group bacterium]
MYFLEKTEHFVTKLLEHNTTSDAKILSKVYDDASASWANRMIFELRARSFNPRLLARKIMAISPVPKGSVNCLDVGCNIGAKTNLHLKILNFLGATDIKFHGIDTSKKAIQIISKLNTNPNVTYEQANFLNMDLKENSYDYIFLAAVWHHIENPALAIKQLEKALKPNGVGIIFNGFYPENSFFRILALIPQRLYRFIEHRNGLHYQKPLISDIEILVMQECKSLKVCGHFLTGFPTNLFNTQMLVLNKRPS